MLKVSEPSSKFFSVYYKAGFHNQTRGPIWFKTPGKHFGAVGYGKSNRYSTLCNHWRDIKNWQVTYENYCTAKPGDSVHDVSRQQALPNLIHCVCHSSPQTLHRSSSHVGYNMYEGSGGKASVTHALIFSLFTC